MPATTAGASAAPPRANRSRRGSGRARERCRRGPPSGPPGPRSSSWSLSGAAPGGEGRRLRPVHELLRPSPPCTGRGEMFDGFNFASVSEFTEKKINLLRSNGSVLLSEQKIRAVVTNAKQMQKEGKMGIRNFQPSAALTSFKKHRAVSILASIVKIHPKHCGLVGLLILAGIVSSLISCDY